MTRKYFVNGAPMVTLTAGINSTTTTIPVTSTAGYPTSFPFTIAIQRSTANEEICLVSEATSTSFTVTRGWDGTTAVAHNSLDTVEHTSSASDFNDMSDHLNDSSNNIHTQYLLKSLISAKGALITGTAASTPSTLTVGTNNRVLIADSTQAKGIKWGQIVNDSITNSTISTAKIDAAFLQDTIQSLASAPTSTSNGQIYYNTTNHRLYNRRDGSWKLMPQNIGYVTYSTGNPSGGIDGDVWLKYV